MCGCTPINVAMSPSPDNLSSLVHILKDKNRLERRKRVDLRRILHDLFQELCQHVSAAVVEFVETLLIRSSNEQPF